MELHLHLEGRKALAAQVYRQLRAAILEGRLAHRDRLPPTRELARRLDVSRNTVGIAYEWLTAEGLLAGRSGAGSFVQADPSRRAPQRLAVRGAPLQQRAVWEAIAGALPEARQPAPGHDFSVGLPDARLFPYDTWRRLLARQIRSSRLPAGYADPAGHPRLREAVARHIAVARGVRAGPDDVLVTHGAQHALDLIGRVLVEPGTCVAVEDPGYPPARLVFESLGARVVGVPVDAEGLDVAALPEAARLVYVTPSHQFPLGMPLSHSRRLALLAWAERSNSVVIEDDYDSEFRFSGRPLEALQALDRTGRVVYVGSFSKTMLPSLRLGFLVAPASLQHALRAATFVGGHHCQWPAQAALASFIEEGLLARHIRKMRREYAARHARLLDTLTEDFSDWLLPVPSSTGIHLSALLRSGTLKREQQLVERAEKADLRVERLSRYYCGGPAPGLVLGYGGIASPVLEAGLERLRTCCAAVTR